MKFEIEIPDYKKEKGFEFSWVKDFSILTQAYKDGILIKANKAGLISLAKQLLTLAQDDYDIGNHLHYDDYNSLDDGSVELIIEKVK